MATQSNKTDEMSKAKTDAKTQAPPPNDDDDVDLEGEEGEGEGENEDVSGDDQAADDQASDDERVKQLEDSLADLRQRLRRANKQAAARRIQLKQLAGKSNDTSDDAHKKASSEDAQLAARYADAQRKLQQYERTGLVSDVLDTMDVPFASARARNDAVEFALAEIGKEFVEDDDIPTDEDLEAAVKTVLKKRPYLLKAKKEPPETDSKKRGSGDGISINEADIAAKFGIKPM